MTAIASHSDRFGRAGRLVVWAGAAALVMTAYGFGIGWLMQRPVDADGADEALPAIMIELATEPVAMETDDNIASVSETDSVEVKSEGAQPLPEPVVEEKIEPKPVEEVPEPVPAAEEEPEEPPPVEQATGALLPEVLPQPDEDPVVEQVSNVLDNVAIPLPLSRPEILEVSEKPPEKVTEKKKRTKKRNASAPASKVAVKARAKVRKADTNSAKLASEGRADSVSSAKWKSRVMVHLHRHKRYPAAARRQRAEGTVQVRFRIDGRGNVLSVSISRSSGFVDLDRAAIAMVRNSSPVPAPPAGASKTIVAPVHFNLK